MQLFEYTTVKHISSVASDHCFVLAELCRDHPNRWPASQRPFRYENVWQTHSDYDKLVLDSCKVGAGQEGLKGVVEAPNSVQSQLGSWGSVSLVTWQKKFGNCRKAWKDSELSLLDEDRQKKNFLWLHNSVKRYGKRRSGSSKDPEYKLIGLVIGIQNFSTPEHQCVEG